MLCYAVQSYVSRIRIRCIKLWDLLFCSALIMSDKAVPECLICHQELFDGEAKQALMCGHVYHAECVESYLQAKSPRPPAKKCALQI